MEDHKLGKVAMKKAVALRFPPGNSSEPWSHLRGRDICVEIRRVKRR